MVNVLNEIRVLQFCLKNHLRSAVFSTPRSRKWERYILERRSVPDFRGSPASYLPTVEAVLGALTMQRRNSMNSLKAMELGTGRHLAVPLILRFLGLRNIMTVDVEDLLLVGQVRAMAAAIATDANVGKLARSLSVDLNESIALFAGIQRAKTAEEILRHLDIRFVAGVDLRFEGAIAGIDMPQPDIIFSNNVLEHIRLEDLRQILLSLTTVFNGKPQLHLVDLGDHIADALPSLHPLHNYRYSKRIWSLLSSNRYVFTNRLTLTDYDSLLCNLGVDYEIEVVESLNSAEIQRVESFSAEDFAGKSLGATRILVRVN